MIDIATLQKCGGSLRSFHEGEVVFEEGSVCTHYHELVSGKVKWINVHEDGREFIQNIILPGESFGELPLFDDLPYAASAVAASECLVARLPKEQFLKCLVDHPDVNMQFTRLFASRLRFKFLISREMGQFDPEHRVTSLLNYLREHSASVCPMCAQVKLTRQEIANMTGLRVETVIRTLKSMASDGKVIIVRGKVFLSDPKGLDSTACQRALKTEEVSYERGFRDALPVD
ncbi:MAG: hypothetical protein RL220_560 [Bacteroidota bacterium]|jgi:CRP-like cAMP-binding protein